MTQEKSKSIGLPLIVSIIAISFSSIFVKWSDAPASIMAMYRMLFASLLLTPMVWKNRQELKKINKKTALFLFFSGVFLALHFVLWFGSLKFTTVASSTIILALQPIISLIGGFFLFKEGTTGSALMTMGIAIIGAFMVGWGDFGLSQEAMLGDLLSFFSVIAVVGYLFIGQTIVKHLSHWIYSFCVFSCASIVLVIYNFSTNVTFSGYLAKEWGIFVLLAIVPTVSHVINNWLMNYVNATTISMSILGEPVGSTVLAYFILGEGLSFWQMAGGVLVLIGVFLFLGQKQKKPIVQEPFQLEKATP
ncbi:DMT family transporter [Neobacillus mesonae]|uniref:DMT family transporter n=1 Tax=Neobacillus mesonae TaxID=1193713 RepID=UPI00082BE4C7|nr:DMT family transporter [Neobacillus mesonae]